MHNVVPRYIKEGRKREGQDKEMRLEKRVREVGNRKKEGGKRKIEEENRMKKEWETSKLES